MNIKTHIVILLILIGKGSYSQDQKLFFDFSWSYQGFKMTDFNEFLSDTSIFYAETYDSTRIENGQQLSFGVRYKFIPTISIGVEGGYQYGSEKKTPTFSYADPNTGDDVITSYDTRIDVRSIRLGLTLGYSPSELLKWSDSEGFTKNMECEVLFKVGLAQSSTNDYLFNANTNYLEERRLNHSSRDWYFEPQIQLTYRLSNSPVFSSVGIKLGYQYLKTKPIESEIGTIFYDQNEAIKKDVTLDFSGIIAGLILTLGN